ncbi:MDR family NADP-dependent oxidoreductase [Dyella terrae]|uniref:MDR family NADP-dependent oxidoreductase n=1 Tax=Dyella terrae TaxID=522259 RepID=UPI001EFEED64|nr:NADP-dependent oxidoreductase [Dyella terrae]ULU25739.1 NADP-dependent oxidoreductase [Dyella terrae]
MHPRPCVSRQVALAAHPGNKLQSTDFTITEVPLPPLAPGQVLLRNRWFRVSVSTRLMASRDAKDIKGIPFPPLKPGDALSDGAIGEVIATTPESQLQVGDIVLHPLGWRDYAIADAHQCKVLQRESIEPAAYLGHGWTAYAALTRGIRIKRGDIVFVSSGAGAIGSMAAQIARNLGAFRVIGSTGSTDKADWMRRDLGYDAVIVRNDGPFIEQLAKAAPHGIDVCVDMVGGEQLSAAVSCAREDARFVILGALVAELNAERSTSVAPADIDTFRLPIMGITLRGYSAGEPSSDAFDEWIRRLDEWQQEGTICLPSTTFNGLDKAPEALQQACEGRLKGVVLVEL